MKILFVATVKSHIGQFHIPLIRRLKELGCSVDAAFKDNSDQKHGLDLSELDNIYEIPFSRSPYSKDNVKAYKMLKSLIDENDYDAVHCHTPMGAVIARLASRDAKKRGMKVIYTAHGFHFYNGASAKNWILYYPVEKYLAKYTDCLITINNEDYKLAKSKFKKAGTVCYVPGVGVELSKFTPISLSERSVLRKKQGYSDNDFLMIYPADFSYRKNQKMLFDALKLVLQKHKNVKLLLPGALDGADLCKRYCDEIGISDYVDYLGYRRDIYDFDGMSDISLSSSRQEGLPINLIEAMALGNPIVATDVRGNNDLVLDGKNGYLVKLNDSETMAKRICTLIENRELVNEFGNTALQMVERYGVDNIISEMLNIYNSIGLSVSEKKQ